ncbi:MAG: response regulator [SAR324 cluster bacterium]|nr:response regulator [SAR324 cluster bacterium]
MTPSTILIVDDNPKNLLAFEDTLAGLNLQILKAQSGDEALKLSVKHDLALILMDVQMPDMDGIETAEILRSIKRTRHIPLIFVTASNHEMIHVFKGYELGAVDYLIKPLPPEILKAKVSVFIEMDQQKKLLRHQAELLGEHIIQQNNSLEQTHEQLQHELEFHNQLVDDKELLETQLRHAQKMEAIGTLAGGIAHDFNNILNIILGYTQLLQGELPKENRGEAYCDIIMQAGLRGARLVKQILTFSRVSEQSFHPVHIHAIVKEALEMLKSTLPPMILVEHQIDANLPMILADPTQIYQILMNLCTNAFHALEGREGVVTVSLLKSHLTAHEARLLNLTAGDYLQLTIRDTGCGMPVHIQERIFEPFFTTKPVGKGTGLGLSVVYGIVKKHQGAIQVHSIPDQGTTFDLFFPVVESVTGENTEATFLRSGNEHLVILDDEPQLRQWYRLALERLGYQVTLFSDGQSVIDYLKQPESQADLLILDYAMPHMSGLDLAKTLIPKHPDLPIVIMTGYLETLSEQELLAIGFRGLLHKPVTLHEFSKVFSRILD